MLASSDLSNSTKPELYRELATQLRALTDDETDPVANMANCAALIFNSVPRLNWAGFYLLKGGELVLGPFQGQPACVRIALGRGVCGTAAESHSTLRVADVTKFPGHIACDSASRSEIVVPLLTDGFSLDRSARRGQPGAGSFRRRRRGGSQSILAKIIARKL